MKVIQAYWQNNTWTYIKPKLKLKDPLVLVFAERTLLERKEVLKNIREEFPYKNIVFSSTAGEIIGSQVLENSITITAIEFEKSSFIIKKANLFDFGKDSYSIGKNLIEQLPSKDLKHIFVISEGSFVNGSKLIEGIESKLPSDVKVTGGICGDNDRFEKTLVSFQKDPTEGEIVIIGFYGESLEFSYASFGGWVPFGPERIITKSEGNILYEIDGIPALDIYSKYLGEKAFELPQSALLFPLNVQASGKTQPVVRTILNINQENKSMIFAGDVPENSRTQLMMASVDAIIEGAIDAAKIAIDNRKKAPEVAFLVSCIGRKMVMDQRTEEEVEEVLEIIGKNSATAGFYSYGEIAPFHQGENCELHNQTMTLTLISE